MRDDKDLLQDLKRGDIDALRCIYERYKNDLLTIATYLMIDQAAAEDCLHDVFVNFAATITDFNLRSNLKGYLITCTANHARDALRRNKRQVSLTDEQNCDRPTNYNADPAEKLLQRERTAALTDALEQLPYDQREVITLHTHGQMTFQQIAQQQNVSINTAQSRYRYGLNKLRSLLTQGAAK